MTSRIDLSGAAVIYGRDDVTDGTWRLVGLAAGRESRRPPAFGRVERAEGKRDGGSLDGAHIEVRALQRAAMIW